MAIFLFIDELSIQMQHLFNKTSIGVLYFKHFRGLLFNSVIFVDNSSTKKHISFQYLMCPFILLSEIIKQIPSTSPFFQYMIL